MRPGETSRRRCGHAAQTICKPSPASSAIGSLPTSAVLATGICCWRSLAENATEGGAELPTAVAVSYVAAFVSALRSGAPLPPLADAGEPSAGEREGLAPRKKEPAATTQELRDALTGNDALHAAPAVALRLSESEATSAWTLICSLASVRPDAHLVKYTFACLRCANRSQHPPLFLAAAVKLLAAWLVRYPEGTKPADLLIDRLA